MAREGQTFGYEGASGPPSGTAPALAAGQQQLRDLIEPPPVRARLSGDWLQGALALTRSAGDFFVRFEGDALLEGRARAAQHLHQRCLLVAPERLASRALALLSVRARGWRGLPTVEQLLARCHEDGAAQLMLEDEREEDYGLSAEPGVLGQYAIAGELFGLASAHWRLALVRFNRLPFPERRGLFDWVVRGIDPPADPQHAAAGQPPSPGWNLPRARSLLAEVLALPEGGVS